MIIVLLALIAVATVNASTKLTILEPSDLVEKIAQYNKQSKKKLDADNENIIDCELANFGTVQYGSRVIGEMFVSKPFNACNETEIVR